MIYLICVISCDSYFILNNIAHFINLQIRIIGYFPKMSIKVCNIAAVTAPKHFTGLLNYLDTFLCKLSYYIIYFLFISCIVSQRKSFKATCNTPLKISNRITNYSSPSDTKTNSLTKRSLRLLICRWVLLRQAFFVPRNNSASRSPNWRNHG